MTPTYQNISYRFSLVQSKSNRFKTMDQMCYDPNGNRIFGEGEFGDEDINCRCSRKRWEMEQKIKKNGNETYDEYVNIKENLCLY